jgi:cysteine desulfurase
MPIYLDYNSTTPVDKRVLEVMLPCFTENFGNAASKTHAFGWVADELVKKSRKQVADFLNAEESEIIFTSGATEAINLAIKGVAEAYVSKGNHIVTFATEHKAVLDSCSHLSRLGKEITILPVNKEGVADLAELGKAIRPDTILVCAMLANNETGLIHPISEIAQIVHAKSSLLFTDATQACGKIPVDVNELHADLLCFSGHKMYGPKGIGALYIRRKNPRVTLIGQSDGGGHERNLRSGTLNVPGIAGLGESCLLAAKNLWEESSRISFLRTKFEQTLTDAGGVYINGSVKNRLPNTSNLLFKGIKAEKLIKHFPVLAFATGSACSSALPEPSHVLLAMGLTEEDAFSSIRISIGRFTTELEIETTAAMLMDFKKLIGN